MLPDLASFMKFAIFRQNKFRLARAKKVQIEPMTLALSTKKNFYCVFVRFFREPAKICKNCCQVFLGPFKIV